MGRCEASHQNQRVRGSIPWRRTAPPRSPDTSILCTRLSRPLGPADSGALYWVKSPTTRLAVFSPAPLLEESLLGCAANTNGGALRTVQEAGRDSLPVTYVAVSGSGSCSARSGSVSSISGNDGIGHLGSSAWLCVRSFAAPGSAGGAELG